VSQQIDQQKKHDILDAIRQGTTVRAVSEQLGVSTKTIYHWLRDGERTSVVSLALTVLSTTARQPNKDPKRRQLCWLCAKRMPSIPSTDIDCATRIKYKRIYPGYDPQTTVDFLEHATRFFAPAFSFTGIQTDNGTEFSYDHFPQVKPATKAAPELWLEAHGITHLRIPTPRHT
jgi:AcrR family transcriptional regulator